MRKLDITEVQNVSLEILKVVSDICEKEGLRYFLTYGTLIGAIRHKGYIPWDDDVDIAMPRPDYEKLLKHLQNNHYENLQVFIPDTCEDYPYMITRVSDCRYEIDMNNEKKYGMGVFIDIYPMDGLGQTPEEALKFGLKGDRLSSLCYQATRKRYAVETTKSTLRKIMKFPVFLFAKICGKNIFQKKLAKLAGQKDYDNNQYIGCVVWLSGGMKDIFKREWYDDYLMVPYEKYQFRVPVGYDQILTQVYGNYMELPPEEDRVGHHEYVAYAKEAENS
jgi:lipopolysaccharide cholinephosphotransferase